jgi:hypothetical protein
MAVKVSEPQSIVKNANGAVRSSPHPTTLQNHRALPRYGMRLAALRRVSATIKQSIVAELTQPNATVDNPPITL